MFKYIRNDLNKTVSESKKSVRGLSNNLKRYSDVSLKYITLSENDDKKNARAIRDIINMGTSMGELIISEINELAPRPKDMIKRVKSFAGSDIKKGIISINDEVESINKNLPSLLSSKNELDNYINFIRSDESKSTPIYSLIAELVKRMDACVTKANDLCVDMTNLYCKATNEEWS